MDVVSITNITTRVLIADRASWSIGTVERIVGLLNRSQLDAGEGLIFPRCNAIHTIGMRFSIDVLFLKTVQGSRLKVEGSWRSSSLEPRTLNLEPILGVVVRAAEHVKPCRLVSAHGADLVIELPAGSIRQTGTQPGHHISLSS